MIQRAMRAAKALPNEQLPLFVRGLKRHLNERERAAARHFQAGEAVYHVNDGSEGVVRHVNLKRLDVASRISIRHKRATGQIRWLRQCWPALECEKEV